VGLSLRAVARLLHENGLRMQLSGWGTAASSDPAAGTLVPKGSVVRVVGELDSSGSLWN